MKPMLFVRKLHKWLGLIVGLQFLLWTISGLVFAWLDHHEVTAEHSVNAVNNAAWSAKIPLAEPQTWLGGLEGELHEVRLMSLLDHWLWRVDAGSRVELRRVEDGAPFHLNEALVRRLALSRYAGEGRLQSVTFQPMAGIEARDAGAVWKAQFGDAAETTLYFAAEDGQLVATRNSAWRMFDFFWMLHTMDYRGRDNFNNPLVIAMATGSLWLSLSGVLLLFRSFRREEFDFTRVWRRERGALPVGEERAR